MELSLFLFSFLIPALIATAILVAWWLVPALRKQVWLRGSIFGIALGVGLLLSYRAENGFPVFPPHRSDIWLGWLGPGMILVALLGALSERWNTFPWLEVCGLLLGTAVAFMPISAWLAGSADEVKSLFPGMEGADHVMLGVVIAFAAVLFGRLQEVRPGAIIPCAFAMVFTVSALTALASGWISLTLFFGVIAAISGAAGLVNRLAGSVPVGRGSVFALCLALVILPVACWCKTTPPEALYWWYWLVLAGAPLLLFPCENRWFEKMPRPLAFWVRFVIVALPTIYVLLMVVPMLAGEPSDGTDDLDAMMKLYE
jgi:hypothetical protein